MIRYLKLDGSIRQFSFDNVDIQDKLPVGFYQMNVDRTGIFLEEEKRFELPKKIYGDVVKNSTRIMKTFESRAKSTGVLLNGLKGSGKTITAKYLCNMAVDLGMPVIIVNNKMPQPFFNIFVRDIEQECVILFDEFEKTHSIERDTESGEDDEQEDLLTLFDGVCSTKKLFILTCNEEGKINEYMLNRPARIYYNIKYTSLSKEEVTEFAEDNLKNKELVKDLLFANNVIDFSYDILNSLIEELNIHACSINEALSIMNIKTDKYDTYNVSSIQDVNGKEIPMELYTNSNLAGNLINGLQFYIVNSDNDYTSSSVTVRADKIISVDENSLTFKMEIPFYKSAKIPLEIERDKPMTVRATKHINTISEYSDLVQSAVL